MNTIYCLNPQTDSYEFKVPNGTLLPSGSRIYFTKDGVRKQYIVVDGWQEVVGWASEATASIYNKVIIREA